MKDCDAIAHLPGMTMRQLSSGALLLEASGTDNELVVVLSEHSIEVHRGGDVLISHPLPPGLAPYAASIERSNGYLRIEIPRA